MQYCERELSELAKQDVPLHLSSTSLEVGVFNFLRLSEMKIGVVKGTTLIDHSFLSILGC